MLPISSKQTGQTKTSVAMFPTFGREFFNVPRAMSPASLMTIREDAGGGAYGL